MVVAIHICLSFSTESVVFCSSSFYFYSINGVGCSRLLCADRVRKKVGRQRYSEPNAPSGAMQPARTRLILRSRYPTACSRFKKVSVRNRHSRRIVFVESRGAQRPAIILLSIKNLKRFHVFGPASRVNVPASSWAEIARR